MKLPQLCLLALLRELQGSLPDLRRQYPTEGTPEVQVATIVIVPEVIVPEEFVTDLLDEVIVAILSVVFSLIDRDAVEIHA